MRTSLSVKNKTSVKNQNTLKNIILSFSFTLVIMFIFLIINTFGVSEKNYAATRSENPYKIKQQLEAAKNAPGLKVIKK